MTSQKKATHFALGCGFLVIVSILSLAFCSGPVGVDYEASAVACAKKRVAAEVSLVDFPLAKADAWEDLVNTGWTVTGPITTKGQEVGYTCKVTFKSPAATECLTECVYR